MLLATDSKLRSTIDRAEHIARWSDDRAEADAARAKAEAARRELFARAMRWHGRLASDAEG